MGQFLSTHTHKFVLCCYMKVTGYECGGGTVIKHQNLTCSPARMDPNKGNIMKYKVVPLPYLHVHTYD